LRPQQLGRRFLSWAIVFSFSSFLLGSSFFALWAILFLQSLFSSSLHDALNRRQSPRLLEQALQTFP